MGKNQEKVLQSMGLMDKDGNIIKEEGSEEYLNDPPKKSAVSRIFGFLFNIITLRFLFKKKQIARDQKQTENNNGDIEKVSTEEIEKAKSNQESKTEDKEKLNQEDKIEDKAKSNQENKSEDKERGLTNDEKDKENKNEKKEESSEKQM